MAQAKLAKQHSNGGTWRGFPPETLINVRPFLRDDNRLSLVSTSGLKAFTNIGTGNQGIKGLFQADGVLNGDIIVVTSTKVYRVSSLGIVTEIGNIVANGRCRFAASVTELVIVVDGKAYQVTEASGVNQLLDSDLSDVSDVVYTAGIFVFLKTNTDRILFSDVLNAGVIGAASWATAESKPDHIVGLASIGGDIAIIGTETIEIWGKTGSSTLPFQARDGYLINVGCASRDSIMTLGDGSVGGRIVWLCSDRTIRISDTGQGDIISSSAVQEELELLTKEELSQVYLFNWAEEGITFIGLQMPDTTWVYDASLKLWHKRDCNPDKWAVGFVVNAWGKNVFGNIFTDSIGYIDVLEKTNLGDPIRKVFSAYLPTDSGITPINSISLKLALGIDSQPDVERHIWMRYSDNRGNTWSNWRQKSLGVQGNFKSSVTWQPCGATKNVGRIMEFEITDPYVLSISSVFINEIGA